ncbi:hypothetical protein FBU59_000549 [Linderina macrospora]|uniref:Uncharacterized protein n=1 Tax=Linderina macrospora TaxID=4868 RepID=A0ACC1JGM6_9FUNG|nr:hypothetical protein FBU59_000549 [Linderina macrospora]
MAVPEDPFLLNDTKHHCDREHKQDDADAQQRCKPDLLGFYWRVTAVPDDIDDNWDVGE